MAQKIVPHLWFDKEAVEVTEFYSALFPDSKITSKSVIHDTPSGDCDVVSFNLSGFEFMAISAGPIFKLNPSISFTINCKTAEEADKFWDVLIDEGEVLMEIGKYPWSSRYGWLQDKYGLSWQIMNLGDVEVKQKIVPGIMYVGNVAGKAEEAINFYVNVFKNAPHAKKESKVGQLFRYGKDEVEEKEGTIAHGPFTLEGQDFFALDSANKGHKFSFNEAVSFMVKCDTQEEIDYFWEKMSAVLESEQCGWLKDKYGVSWQIVPTIMDKMMGSGDKEKMARVTEAFLKMKKFDVAKLEEAYGGK